MTYQSPSLAFAPDQSTRIAVLRCRDDFAIDPAQVLAIFACQAEHEAESTICRALEDVAARLDRVQLARTCGTFDQISGPAKRIASVAGGLGLTEVVKAAGHVAITADSGCPVALGATMSRLERAFDAAVSEIWEYRQYI